MEKLVISCLLIACFWLKGSDHADAYTIGILHDPEEIYAEDIEVVLRHVEDVNSFQSVSINFLLLPVQLDGSNWTVCQLLDTHTMVALVAVGSCQFHSYLSLWNETRLPFPVVVIETNEENVPCSHVMTWSDPVLRGSNRYYLWLPFLVADTLDFVKSNHLVIVFSAQYVRQAQSTAEHLSRRHTESVLLTVGQFLELHLDHELHVQTNGGNSSVPILIVATPRDADTILSKFGMDTDHWLVFTGSTFNVSESSQMYEFYIVPRFQTTLVNMQRDLHRTSSQLNTVLQLIAETLKHLLERPNLNTYNVSTDCGNGTVGVSSVADQLRTELSRNKFDDRGYLSTDHFDITVSDAEGARHSGHWNVSGGLTMSTELRRKFSPELLVANKTLIVGTEEAPPFTVLENNTWKGFCVDMLEELSLRMGFKYEIRRSVDNLWGAPNEDGSWNGLVGMAVRGEIDMAIGPISVTAERETVVDFTKPFMESAAGLLMMRFEDTTAKMFRTLMPFTVNVWLTLAGLVILIGLVFGLINKFSPIQATPDEKHPDRWIESMWDSFWVVLGSFMEQGAERFPHSVAGRVVLGLWWVFNILTAASYTASLAAFLTINMADIPINSLSDLAQQSHILPLIKNGSNLYTLFQNAETPIQKKIYEMMQQAPIVLGNDNGMELVMSGPYALLTDREQLDLLAKVDCKNLVQAEEHFNNNGLGFFVREGSPILETLSNNIIKLMEAGLIHKWRRKWWSSTDVCSEEVAMTSVQSLKLDSTAGLFILYAVSTVLAFIILMGERAVNKLWPLCKAVVASRRTVEV